MYEYNKWGWAELRNSNYKSIEDKLFIIPFHPRNTINGDGRSLEKQFYISHSFMKEAISFFVL